jgi:malonyl-CoA O-methyltransferase
MAASPVPVDDPRGLDPVAVAAVLRRLARAGDAPWLHQEVARRMAERLAIVRLQPGRVLDWWSHLGAGAALLERAYPAAQRIAVEPTAALVARSRAAARRPWWSAQRWSGAAAAVVAEGEALPGGAELVWANMVLHGVADPPALFARWHEALAVGGFVMFSGLGPGTLRELRTLYARLGWPVPTPAFVDMHDLGDMLVRAGFADPVMDQETITLQWADATALLAELRALGGNAAPQRFGGLRTPRWRARLLEALASLAGADGRPALSFEVAYGHAFRAAPRARPGEPTTVSLEAMRSMVRSGRPGPSG